MREVRKKYTRALQDASSETVLGVARALMNDPGSRWIGYELIQNHPAAFRRVDRMLLEEFGRGMESWWAVDQFARILAGPAWLAGQVPDRAITAWARSKDRWRRRAALVSTVALNIQSQGGKGDSLRTLRICRLLAADHDDMVAKALSWALRALAVPQPAAVRSFLEEHDDTLAARVKREVRSKLKTGLKNASYSKRNRRASR